MKSKISIYAIILLVFLVVWSLWASSSFNEIQMSYDESRHAAGAMIWYDYIKTISSDGYMSFSTFLGQYQQKGYNAGWFANVDPPMDGLVRVPFYMMFGDTFFGVRAVALFSAIVSAILVYVIAYHITKRRAVALASSIILLMSTLFYMYTAIQALAAVPNAMMVLFWYYFTFVRKAKKNYNLRLFRDMVVTFNWNIVFGGLFFTFSVLTKYSAGIFLNMFFLIYFIYLIAAEYWKTRKIGLHLISASGALQIVFITLIQNIIFLIISYKWLKFNLFDNGMLSRFKLESGRVTYASHDLNYLGLERPYLWKGVFANYTYLVHGYLQRTLFFIIFFFYTVYLLIKGKVKNENTRKHMIIISIFFFAVYLYFSLKMGNHQVRYAVHPFPFVVIAAAYGLYRLVNRIVQSKRLLVFWIVVLLFGGSLYMLDTWMYNKTYAEFGPKNEELLDFLETKSDPKFMLHTRGGGGVPIPSGSWYYNPDFVMFTFLRSKQGHNPFSFQQSAQLFEFREGTPQSPTAASPNLISQLTEVSKQVPTYVVIYRYHSEEEIYNLFGQGLLDNNFSPLNMTYWTLYYKE